MSSKANVPPANLDKGLPRHGATVDNGVALRAVSRGPGVPVPVSPPFTGQPRRVVSGQGEARWLGDQLVISPTSTPAGEEFALIVEP